MELFYAKPENVKDHRIILDDFERQHIIHTLRKKVGDILTVTDGRGTLFTSRITQLSPHLELHIESSEKQPFPQTEIILASGFIKQNRMEFILEKGTELGIKKFLFFKSRFANYFSSNTKRYEKIVRQALKQSLQSYLPGIQVFDSFEKFVSYGRSFETRLVAVDPKFSSLFDLFSDGIVDSNKPVLVVIGPEGGFSPEEIELFKNNRFTCFSLGKNRLRTETAAISAISIINHYIQQ
ncbi:MAG: 16S rRNA (uracil(1498)-N(3))-methyltransferase [Calditrichaeota bacterium]|nr:16S rRNA (uracil(1498)-N(3))-methyltransferase [Calditrichota bacterium]